jgi:hypothetical protein
LKIEVVGFYVIADFGFGESLGSIDLGF